MGGMSGKGDSATSLERPRASSRLSRNFMATTTADFVPQNSCTEGCINSKQ
jgi:hypothetical protein